MSAELKNTLKKLYVEALRLPAAPESLPDEHLTAALGLDSINSLELLILVENQFNIQIDDEDLSVTLVDSLDVLADYVSKKLALKLEAQVAVST